MGDIKSKITLVADVDTSNLPQRILQIHQMFAGVGGPAVGASAFFGKGAAGILDVPLPGVPASAAAISPAPTSFGGGTQAYMNSKLLGLQGQPSIAGLAQVQGLSQAQLNATNQLIAAIQNLTSKLGGGAGAGGGAPPSGIPGSTPPPPTPPPPKPSDLSQLLKGVGATSAINTVKDVIVALVNQPLMRESAMSDVGRMRGNLVGATTRLTAEDLLVTLNPGDFRAAASAAGRGRWAPAVATAGATIAGAVGAGLASGGMGLIPAIGATLIGAGGGFTASGGINQLFTGFGLSMEATRARSFETFLRERAGQRSVQIAAGDAALERLGLRSPFGAAFGLNFQQTSAMGVGPFAASARQLGFTEAEQLNAIMAGQGFGRSGLRGMMSGLPGMLTQARAFGLDPTNMMGQAVGLLGPGAGDVGGALTRQEDMIARAVSRGMNTSFLIRQQTDAITELARSAGGTMGAVGMNIAQGIMSDPGLRSLPPVLRTGAAASAMSTMNSEGRQRGGLLGMTNLMAAQRFVNQFLPGMDSATKATTAIALQGRTGAEVIPLLESLGVANPEQAGAAFLRMQQEAQLPFTQGIGGGPAVVRQAAFGFDRDQPLGTIMNTFGSRRFVRGGGLENAVAGMGAGGASSPLGVVNAMITAAKARVQMDPNLQRIGMGEEAKENLAAMGLTAIDAAVTRLAKDGGSLAVMKQVIEGMGKDLGNIKVNADAASVLERVANALASIANSGAAAVHNLKRGQVVHHTPISFSDTKAHAPAKFQ